MEALRIWLFVVAALSIFGAFLGVFWPDSIRFAQFNVYQDQVTPLAARFFTAWTLLASIIRLLGAIYLHEKGSYLATMATFLVAFYVYGTEILIYQTITVKTAWGPLLIASTTFTLMSISYSRYFPPLKQAKGE